MRKRLTAIVLVCAVLAFAQGSKLPKPGFNLFSKEQDIQLGREAAAQIERQHRIVDNQDLTGYVNRVGMRLVREGELEQYPFFFKVVHEDSINAFALPGGPMYVHTGLIKAAENEAQLAGVLSHELSHVVLRHGTNQVTKAQGIQLIAMLGGAAAGGGLLGSLSQMGIGLGANSVLMKYSRNAERDADLLGMHTMAKAGYNPLEMARFFERLQGESSRNSKLAEFFSSHPNPGNRVRAVEKELPYLPKREYGRTEGDLNRVKQDIDRLGPAPKGPQQSAGPPPQADRPPQIQLSGRMRDYQGGGVAFSYPDSWERIGQKSTSVTLAPREAVVQGQGSNYALGYGIIAGSSQPQSGSVNLSRDTQTFLQNLAQANPGARVEGRSEPITIDRSPGLASRLSADAPYKGLRETIVVLTVDRQNALYYFIFVAPEHDYKRLEPAYQRTAQSIRFR